jgi:hypothetical protein
MLPHRSGSHVASSDRLNWLLIDPCWPKLELLVDRLPAPVPERDAEADAPIVGKYAARASPTSARA